MDGAAVCTKIDAISVGFAIKDHVRVFSGSVASCSLVCGGIISFVGLNRYHVGRATKSALAAWHFDHQKFHTVCWLALNAANDDEMSLAQKPASQHFPAH